jgi:hypothetical protein
LKALRASQGALLCAPEMENNEIVDRGDEDSDRIGRRFRNELMADGPISALDRAPCAPTA